MGIVNKYSSQSVVTLITAKLNTYFTTKLAAYKCFTATNKTIYKQPFYVSKFSQIAQYNMNKLDVSITKFYHFALAVILIAEG